MSYFGVSLRNGVGLGLGTVPSLTNTPLSYRLAPSLDLSFAGSDALSPAITFSRTTNATLTNSAGLIANAPMNLLTFSEQFDNAAWTKQQTTVTANAAVAPNGTTTADKLIETIDTNSHIARQDFSAISGNTYTFTTYLKAAELRYAQLWFGTLNSGASFDLVAGTSSAITGFNNPLSHSITSVGNGWYRCAVSFTSTSTTTSGATVVYLSEDGNFANRAYTGDGVSGLFLWGAQLELGSTATTYNPTTVKNLLGFTEHFDNAAWTKSNASISATKVDDIYGQPFAQKLVETTAASVAHRVGVSLTVGTNPFTTSVYFKAAERSWAYFQMDDAASTKYAYFDLDTGSVGTVTSGITASIVAVGSGWYRCAATFPSPSAGAGSVNFGVTTANGVFSYTGDGTSGIYIFGAQLSDSASVDPYVYQPVAAPTSTAYYGPRFDYDPVTLAPKGLLIEEQRANLLLNSATLSTQVVTVAATAHTLSFYGTGTIVLSGASTGTVVGTGAYPARTTLTFTPTVGVLTLTVTGSVTMAQLEAGAFATSYIPTVASQVTRAADSASMIGNNFARWYNQTEGTLFGQASSAFIPASTAYGIATVRSTSANAIGIGLQADLNASASIIRSGDVTQAIFGAATANNQTYKMGLAYATNNAAFSIGGAAVQTDATVVLPVVDALYIGQVRQGTIAGTEHIQRIAYYPRRLANTELTSITS